MSRVKELFNPLQEAWKEKEDEGVNAGPSSPAPHSPATPTLPTHPPAAGAGDAASSEDGQKNWKLRAQQLREQRSARDKNKMFGVPIQECVGRVDRVDVPENIPWLVYDIINYLRERSMDMVGLFRLAGEKQTLDELRREIDHGK